MEQRGVREIGRELAFHSIYIFDNGLIPLPEILDFKWYDEMVRFFNEEGELSGIPDAARKAVYEFAGQLLNGTVSNLSRIDQVIEAHLVKWIFSRLHAVDKAILRISVYSILYQQDIPIEVIIAEANELSDKYSDEKAAHYINGILNNVKNEYRRNFLLDSQKAPPKKKKLLRFKKKK